MPYNFENDPTVEKFYLKDGMVLDKDGNPVDSTITQGINLIIRKTPELTYNASLLSKITNTPIHFWQQASESKRDFIMKMIKPELKALEQKLAMYRESELARVYAKRSRRAVNARQAKKNQNNDPQN